MNQAIKPGWQLIMKSTCQLVGRAATAANRQILTMISFGNGVPMSLRVARRLAAAGVTAQVLDLRWLAPLPVEDMLAAARSTGQVLVVDETRHSGGVGEGVVTALVEGGFTGPIHRVSARTASCRWAPLPSMSCSARMRSKKQHWA